MDLYAYLDESGNADLCIEKMGASNLYICVAVLVDNEQQTNTREAIEILRKECFSGGIIKSSNIGNNIERRISVLSQISKMDFGYYAIVIDKSRIDRDSGLKYKQSFYKYLNRMLYNKLTKSGHFIHFIVDMHGCKSFMDSFGLYLSSKGLLPLEYNQPIFKKGSEEPLIQLADLVCGSLQFVYDPDKKGDHSNEILRLLSKKQIGIDSWPRKYSTINDMHESSDDIDSILHHYFINRAIEFEQNHFESSDVDRQMQIIVLSHLLLLNELNEGQEEAVFSDELIKHLNMITSQKLTKQSLLSRVIGPLRDEGFVIAGDNEGYRLAISRKSIELYLLHDKGIIEPMLRRLRIARESVKLATMNRFDILSSSEYTGLQELVDNYQSQQLIVS